MRIEIELAKQMARRCENITKGHSNIKVNAYGFSTVKKFR